MKALPSIAFNDFSGSAKDVTARSTSGGTILSIELYWLDPANGLVGETMRTTAICMSEAQAKEEGFTPRVQFFNDMFEDPKAHLVSADVEMPGGTSQMVVEGVTDIKGFGSYFTLYSEDTPEEFFEGDTMVFSRSQTARNL